MHYFGKLVSPWKFLFRNSGSSKVVQSTQKQDSKGLKKEPPSKKVVKTQPTKKAPSASVTQSGGSNKKKN